MPLEKEISSQPINLKPEILAKLKTHILDRFEYMKKYRDQLDQKVREYIRLYNAQPKPKEEKYKWQSNVFVPYVFSLIQTLFPRLYQGLFGGSKMVACEAREENFVEKEERTAAWFESMLEKMVFKKKARESLLASLKYPMSIIKNLWITRTVIGWKRGFLGIPLPVIECINEPGVDVIHFFDFWWDPDATSMENCKDCIHRVVRDFKYLKKLKKIYSNVDAVKDTQMDKDITEIKQELDIYDQYASKDNTNPGYQDVELLEYWGSFDINEDGEDEEIVATIANRSVIIRSAKNIYWEEFKPFNIIAPMIEDSQFTGMPFIKMQASLQHELNTYRNQRIDNVNLLLRKLWVLREDSDTDLEDVVASPGNVIKMENPEDLRELEIHDVTQNAAIEENRVITDMKQVAAISDYWMGPAARSSDTARGINQISTEMGVRENDMISNLALQFEGVFQKMAMMCKQFKDRAETFRTTNEGAAVFDTISYADIQGSYFFKLILKSQDEASVDKLSQLVQLLNILGNFPWINVPELSKSILQAARVMNIDKIMNAANYANNIKVQMAQALNTQKKPPNVSINFKDLSPEGQIQAAAEAGINIGPQNIAPGMSPTDLIGSVGQLGGPVNPVLPAASASPTGLGPLSPLNSSTSPGGSNG